MRRKPSTPSNADFGILGPLDVRVANRLVPIRSPKLRILLGVLLLNAGRPVMVRQLAEALWGARQPRNPRSAVQLCVTRLRSQLAAAGCPPVVVTGTDGYLIDVAAEQTDLGRFEHWMRQAARAAALSDLERESVALGRALGQWRGEPLADLQSELLQREQAPALREQRLRALERRIEVDLQRGRHLDLVRELVALTAQEPVRERLWAQLMTALYRCGRRSEALAAYHTVRRHLADELGIDPGQELRQLHARVLAGVSADASAPVAVPVVPRQLPAGPYGFTGRASEVTRLDTLLAQYESQAQLHRAVMVISGTAGVGKTALAQHWSRRVADRFPDGQLWVDLHGYDDRPAVPPGEALVLFLNALGVSGRRVPRDVVSQAGLYRSLTDGRRMLVVADNASSPDQVRPLLPGPGSLFLVTSRSQLSALAVADGAHTVVLDSFTADEARQMLERRIGVERVSAEPAAVADIIERCARLPLALSVVAARAAAHPRFPLHSLAAQLRNSRLDALSLAASTAGVRTVFSWSYQALTAESARLFRLLSLLTGPDFCAACAARLAGLPAPHVRPLLAELADVHLTAEYRPGRFTLHGLLRDYATELADRYETAARPYICTSPDHQPYRQACGGGSRRVD